MKIFSSLIVFSYTKVKAIIRVTIIRITAIFTIFTVFVTINLRAYTNAVVLNHQKHAVMNDIVQFDTVNQYNTYNNHETMHPLVSVVDLSKATCTRHQRMNMGIYTVLMKDVVCGDLRYGNNYYDYQEGTLIFFAPGQVYSLENEKEFYESKGYALVFHPDLLRGTPLGRRIHEYTFFSYNVNEALHLSEQERQVVIDCLHKIGIELQHAVDKHSKTLIVSNIELFLNYCGRFYDRQFITREHAHKGILERFERLLNDYFTSDKPQTNGLPSVAWCAGELNLSPNYFGDLVKKETGKSAQEYIQLNPDFAVEIFKTN